MPDPDKILNDAEERFLERDLEDAEDLLGELEEWALSAFQKGRRAAMRLLCADYSGQVEDLGREISRIVEENETDEAFVSGLGIQFSELGEYSLAEVVLAGQCYRRPDLAKSWYNLGIVQSRDGRPEAAVEALSQALTLDHRMVQAAFELGECYSAMGEYERAQEAYNAYLAVEPEDGDAWISLGIAASDGLDYERAVQAFERAFRLTPHSVPLFYNWTITAARAGDKASMGWCIENLQEDAPSDPRTELAMGFFAELEGPCEEALLHFTRAVDLSLAGDEYWDMAFYCAARFLQYATRIKATDRAEAMVERVFKEELFDQDILDCLRELHGRQMETAKDFRVDVEVPLLEMGSDLEGELPERSTPQAYSRMYRVFADSEEEASRSALVFEERCGGFTARLSEQGVEKVGTAKKVYSGVWWRMPEPVYYSLGE